MLESPKFKDIQAAEREQLDQEKHLLEQTPGFQNLSPKQQQFILSKLIVQQRSDRETQPGAAACLGSNPGWSDKFAPGRKYVRFPDNPEDAATLKEHGDPYFNSHLQVMDDYCFDMPRRLEAYVDEKDREDSWVEIGVVTSYQELLNVVELTLEEGDYPLVVDVRHENGPDEPRLRHVTILLGPDEHGDMVVWEKAGGHMPYRTAYLKDVYDSYATSQHWRMRPLGTEISS